jgi:deoxyribonuclease-4
MPKVGLNGEKCLGYDAKTMKELTRDKFGICLDFGHAVKAAVSLHVDYKRHLNEFLQLKPKMFHICDGKLNYEKDRHLNIGEGDFEFEFLVECIKKNESKYVTLETPRENSQSLEEDIKNLKTMKSLWKL